MVKMEVNNENILLTIPKNFISNDYFEKLLLRLRVEELAKSNMMNQDQANSISEEINDKWWSKNKEFILNRIDKEYEINS